MASFERPTLIVFAGPNGSGKTTLAQAMQQRGWLGDCTHINPDEMARSMFGDWNDLQAVRLAVEEATRMRESHLEARWPMVLETVLSSPDKLAYLARCKNAGYFVRFFFIATDDPEINVQRVRDRVMLGGHDVPEDKVRSRYPKSLAHCTMLLQHLDRCYVLDNSDEGEPPKLMFHTSDGRVTRGDAKPRKWSNDMLKSILARQ